MSDPTSPTYVPRDPTGRPLKRHCRKSTITLSRHSRAQRALVLLNPAEHDRPKTRGDCEDGPRPCPYYGCRYNLSVDVAPAFDQDSQPIGNVQLHHTGPEDDPESFDMPAGNCALDYADTPGGMTLEEIGAVMGITRERVRQIEHSAVRKVQAAASLPRGHGVTAKVFREYAESIHEPGADGRVLGRRDVDYGWGVYLTGGTNRNAKV